MDAFEYYNRLESFSVAFDIGCGDTIREMFKRAYKNITIRQVAYEIQTGIVPLYWFSNRVIQIIKNTGKIHNFTEVISYTALLASTQSIITQKTFDLLTKSFSQTGIIELVNIAREAYFAPSIFIKMVPIFPQITYNPQQGIPFVSSTPSILSIPVITGGTRI